MKKVMYVIMLIILAFNSCDKNEIISAYENNKQGILTFSTIEEFSAAVQKVNTMNSDERLAWESSKGFKSFGTICEEFYCSINYENFSNFEEIKSFVETNKSYIQLIQDSNGEISCVTREYDRPERYIMNENRMYIVGGRAYKIFPDNKKVSCDIAHMEKLKAIADLNQIAKDQGSIYDITEMPLPVRASTKSIDQYFERMEKKSIGNKNYRTIVRIETVTFLWNSLGLPGTISYAIWYRIRNQSQFIIWWNTNARTEYAPFNYEISNGYDVFSGSLSNPLWWIEGESFVVNDDEIKGYIGSYPYHEPQQSAAVPYIVSFEGYVYSTFARNNETTTITINLSYPY